MKFEPKPCGKLHMLSPKAQVCQHIPEGLQSLCCSQIQRLDKGKGSEQNLEIWFHWIAINGKKAIVFTIYIANFLSISIHVVLNPAKVTIVV